MALAIANNAHPKEIQSMMGHSSISVTFDVYRHLFDSLGEALAEGVAATYQAALVAPAPPSKITAIGGPR